MKFMRTTLPLLIMLAAVLAGGRAFAQSVTNNVPGPTDYNAFSKFIADRNIFDANRRPHHPGAHRVVAPPRTYSAAAPAFSLVGTMSYQKGVFAFFNGNSDDLKKALLVSGQIADYTVAKINYGRVMLETTNQKQKVEMKVGDVMREENGVWQMTGPGDLTPDGGSSGTNHDSNGAAADNGGGSHPAPASTNSASDILKRLMERRKEENQ